MFCPDGLELSLFVIRYSNTHVRAKGCGRVGSVRVELRVLAASERGRPRAHNSARFPARALKSRQGRRGPPPRERVANPRSNPRVSRAPLTQRVVLIARSDPSLNARAANGEVTSRTMSPLQENTPLLARQAKSSRGVSAARVASEKNSVSSHEDHRAQDARPQVRPYRIQEELREPPDPRRETRRAKVSHVLRAQHVRRGDRRGDDPDDVVPRDDASLGRSIQANVGVEFIGVSWR